MDFQDLADPGGSGDQVVPEGLEDRAGEGSADRAGDVGGAPRADRQASARYGARSE